MSQIYGVFLMTTTSRTDNPTAAPIPSFNSFAKLPAFDAASFTQAFKLLGFDVKTVLDIQRRNVDDRRRNTEREYGAVR